MHLFRAAFFILFKHVIHFKTKQRYVAHLIIFCPISVIFSVLVNIEVTSHGLYGICASPTGLKVYAAAQEFEIGC